MSAVHAIENAFGVTVGGQLRALRRLIYCGEWIESHALHVVMLHAPDFLGYPDAIEMARDHGDAVRRGLALKKAGNELDAPSRRARNPSGQRQAGRVLPRAAARGTRADRRKIQVRRATWRSVWFAGSRRFRFRTSSGIMSLSHCVIPTNIRSTKGGSSPTATSISTSPIMRTEFEERHVAHSTALHSLLKRRGAYLVGPLARYALNFDRLPAVGPGACPRGRTWCGLQEPVSQHHRARPRDRLRLRGGAAPDRRL